MLLICKRQSFSFTHIRGGAGGEEVEWVGVGLQLLWSRPGGIGALLAGKEAGRVARAWELGWEKLLKLPTSALERWAAFQRSLARSQPAPTHPQIQSWTALAYLSKQTHTRGSTHTRTHTSEQHTQTHFGCLFICWSARWDWALIGPGGDWQGERSNEEARFPWDKQQEGEWQEEKGHRSTSRGGTTTEEGK